MIAAALSTVDAALDPVAAWLGTFALHSTVALLTTWCLTRWLGRRRLSLQDALLRQAVWLPFVSASLQLACFGSLWSQLSTAPPLSSEDLLPLVVGSSLPAPGEAGAPAAAAPTPWATIVVGAACVLALTGSLWLGRAWWRLRGVLTARRPETDPRVLAAAARLADALGLRHSPQVSRSDRLGTPIAFGLLRPEICLPSRAAGLDDAALDAVLSHELQHLRRNDPAWMWAAACVQALFPWQVLLLGVRRQWSRVAELRCDAAAVDQTSPTAVARCLIEVADWLRPRPAPSAVALNMAARPSALRERVEAALGAAKAPAARRRASVAGATISLALLTAAAPGLDGETSSAPSVAGFASALRADEGALASRLQPYVALVEADYAAVVREARQLQAELRAHPVPEIARLHEALQTRLDVLARLRARLRARLGRAVPSFR